MDMRRILPLIAAPTLIIDGNYDPAPRPSTATNWPRESRAADYAWGDELAPGGAMLANYWQGLFPFANQLTDGWLRTSPVRAFPLDTPQAFHSLDR